MKEQKRCHARLLPSYFFDTHDWPSPPFPLSSLSSYALPSHASWAGRERVGCGCGGVQRQGRSEHVERACSSRERLVRPSSIPSTYMHPPMPSLSPQPSRTPTLHRPCLVHLATHRGGARIHPGPRRTFLQARPSRGGGGTAIPSIPRPRSQPSLRRGGRGTFPAAAAGCWAVRQCCVVLARGLPVGRRGVQ